jgi:3-oxoacyl-[acyl-carrier-protein] synthase-3
MHQLALADGLIASGRARRALLVQSSATSRLLDPADPISPTFGDAATAAVVGAVPAGRGILAHAHFADGEYANTLVAGVPGARWYDAGRPVLYIEDPAAERRVFLQTLDRAREAVDAVLARAGLAAADIDFFGVHQGTPWLRRLAQDHAGLAHARSVDTYARTAYVFAASIPLGLALAEREGRLSPGDRVLLFGGGTGMTFGAIALVWGAA